MNLDSTYVFYNVPRVNLTQASSIRQIRYTDTTVLSKIDKTRIKFTH